ncbi:MAG: hypothetical protein ACRYGI_11570 [Janthinobacterium lividum]
MTCDNPAQAYRELQRQARKDHQCCECGNTILRGDYYLYTSGIWDGRGECFKTCWQCLAFRNRARRENAGWRGYDEPYIGQLYDDYPTEELPKHHPDTAAEASDNEEINRG